MRSEFTQRKQFITNLPKLRKSDVVPQTGPPDAKKVFIVPIWSTRYNIRVYTRGAAYVLRSWRAFTDMKEKGVASYIHTFSEDTDVYELLLKEKVPPDSILVDPRPKLSVTGKSCLNKIYAILAPHFEGVEYLTVSDADTFVLGDGYHKLPFFHKLLNAERAGVIGNQRETSLDPCLDYIQHLESNTTGLNALLQETFDKILKTRRITFFPNSFFSVYRPLFLKNGWWENILESACIDDDEFLMMLWESASDTHTCTQMVIDHAQYEGSWQRVASAFDNYFELKSVKDLVKGMPPFIFHPEATLSYLVGQVLRERGENS